MYIKEFILLLFIAILLSNICEGGDMKETNQLNQQISKSTYKSIKDVPESIWKNLSEKKIYFGHQSVGNNIIDGLKDVMKDNPQIKLNIIETNDSSAFNTPIFAHSRVGKNTDPKSKCDDFVKFMEQGIGNNVDFSFFKFCYVDVKANTDIKKIFKYYDEQLAYLKEKYPEAIFIHVTVPLSVVQKGVRVWIKSIIGRPIGGYDDNIKRNQLNNMIRNEYDGQGYIFDLAGIESTLQDGRRESFGRDGKAFNSLVPEYSHDGRHLNETGRRIVAGQLLVFLANLLEQGI